jgi:hypothetical protein
MTSASLFQDTIRLEDGLKRRAFRRPDLGHSGFPADVLAPLPQTPPADLNDNRKAESTLTFILCFVATYWSAAGKGSAKLPQCS